MRRGPYWVMRCVGVWVGVCVMRCVVWVCIMCGCVQVGYSIRFDSCCDDKATRIKVRGYY